MEVELDKSISIETISKLKKLGLKKYAKDIEKSIYSFSEKYVIENEITFMFEQIYLEKSSEIINKLKESDNELIELIKNEKISAIKLAELKPEELNPKIYENILKKKEIKKFKEENKSANSSFKCSKCKNKKKFQVSQKQTRAGDEPITTFVKCLECGYTFKF